MRTPVLAGIAAGLALAAGGCGPGSRGECGDGRAGAGDEECDDGNLTVGDGCDGRCSIEAGWMCSGDPSLCAPVGGACGDGTVDSDEECDDGNVVDGDGCSSQCVLVPLSCGDSAIDIGEECDDGAETAACDVNCTFSMCGDGTFNVTAGEACDGGAATATCDADCTLALCGDGTVNGAAGETCDTSVMSVECDADCTAPMCGDGVVNGFANEGCDTGGGSATCDNDCTPAVCGDGTPNGAAGEQCDTSTQSATCDDDCTFPVCGDAVWNWQSGEECEDGDAVSGDGCSSTCAGECGGGAASVTTVLTGGLAQHGVMFDVTAVDILRVDSFDTLLPTSSNTVEIHYVLGGYLPFVATASAWTLVGATTVVGNGAGVSTAIPLAIDVVIPAGGTVGFYVTIAGTAFTSCSTGTTEGAVAASDGSLEIREGRSVEYPFGLTAEPRVFNGTVHYSTCP